jgi:hypothetical protein
MSTTVVIVLPTIQTFHQHLGSLSPSLVELFDAMCSEDPLCRPSASEAFDRIRRLDISQETLTAKVPTIPVDYERIAAEHEAYLAAHKKKARGGLTLCTVVSMERFKR